MNKSLETKLAAIRKDPAAANSSLPTPRTPTWRSGSVRRAVSRDALGRASLPDARGISRADEADHRLGLVDIMLMSASSNYALTFRERLFDGSPVTPAVRANDHRHHLARGARITSSLRGGFRTASIDHIQCGHIDWCRTRPARQANLGLFSVTFNNNLEAIRHPGTISRLSRGSRRKGFRYFLEVFDPNMPGAVKAELLPSYINDMIGQRSPASRRAGGPCS